MPLNIRPAVREDAALILRFITDLAIYEKAEHEVKTDVAGIENSLFGEGSTAHGLICELDGEPIGYAVYFFNYSTWLGKHGLYLEDLYVTPEQRGAGAALLRGDVQVFQVQAVLAQPGRVVEEIHGVADRLAVQFADQAVGSAALAEQAVLDAGNISLHLVLGLLVNGQVSDEAQDQRGVFAYGRADVQGHEVSRRVFSCM